MSGKPVDGQLIERPSYLDSMDRIVQRIARRKVEERDSPRNEVNLVLFNSIRVVESKVDLVLRTQLAGQLSELAQKDAHIALLQNAVRELTQRNEELTRKLKEATVAQ